MAMQFFNVGKVSHQKNNYVNVFFYAIIANIQNCVQRLFRIRYGATDIITIPVPVRSRTAVLSLRECERVI